MSEPTSQGPFCQHCKQKRCNRRSRILVTKKLRVWVCSNCIYNDMQSVRAWLERLKQGESP